MKRLVIFSGAGISAESGIQTFRGKEGLWEEHRIEDVASPGAWQRDPKMVLRFYNDRRKQVIDASPNAAHKVCFELEKHFDVDVITQNIDDLHERAGSSKVLHLHGEIRKAQSSNDSRLVSKINGAELNWGDLDPEGEQLRPNVVWFGEEVPMIIPAMEICSRADILIVVGTSLNVYPAANLAYSTNPSTRIVLIDPDPNIRVPDNVLFLQENASTGMKKIAKKLVEELSPS